MTSIDTMPTMAESGPAKAEKVETGLQSPPETTMKDNTSDSDLSDLEPEQDSIPEQDKNELHDLKPDHYSPDGSVPVFKPSMGEFADFQRYMRGVNSYGMRHGIIKVVPPPEWLANQPPLDEAIKTIRIKEPIKQDIMGTSGTYRQANILHQRSYNLPQWRQLCDQSEHQPPAKRGERRANQDKPAKATPRPKAPAAPKSSGKKKGPGRSFKSKSKTAALQDEEGTATPDRLPTPDSPSVQPGDEGTSVKHEELGDDECTGKPKGGRQPKAISVSSRRKFNRREAAAKIDEEAFKNFNHELEGVDYSQERCDELERAYWKTLTYAPPLYGADMMGTLFDDRTTTWNLGKLENLLDVLGTEIPGVNTAYLYLGMWKATFAWHLEDVDLYSINYLHFGAPKQWYSISQGDARRFEAAMKTIWPTDAKACDQFLRHKTFLISPSQLMQNFNIKVNKIVHYPGEFVITFPYGYHSGYNLGYNCAEAVNFALDSWLEYGRVAKKCDCSQAQDSVWIDVPAIERKMRGEETEYEESEDDEEDEEEEENEVADVTTVASGPTKIKIKVPSKKRKRNPTDKIDSNVKRIRVRIKAPSREPCVLCPNDIPSEPLLQTEDGLKAHRICALYIPETSVDGETEVVHDIKLINKARLDLKCNYCRSKKGACFQCSQKKCTRAYHATCAAAAGVLVEQGETPVWGTDGTEYKDWGIEFSCRFHRAKRDKKLDSEALGENERILTAASTLKVRDVCQLQYYKGDIFAGTVVENRKSEQMLLVDILPRGARVEIEYKWLLIPDPSDYHLAKPSANAIPMPKSREDKQSLGTTRRLADDLPRAEDLFGEGFTWAEFNRGDISRNPFQVKVNLKRDDQVWYYLGKTSTEAKAQFTEDPTKPRHNPKGHFLDTIPKPAPAAPRQSFAASYPTLNQNISTNSQKMLVKPHQAGTSKVEKPYVYKPRNSSGETYSIDPQAYRSQQTFLQQSQQVHGSHHSLPPRQTQQPQQKQLQQPHPAQSMRSTDHVQQGQQPHQFHATYAKQQPQVSQQFYQTQRAPTYSFGTDPRWQQPQTKPSVTSYGQPSPTTSLPQQSTTPIPATNYRPPFTPTYSPAYKPTTKPNNPFSGKAQQSKPNPFAKYSYLQKEHNRSPLEYKTPYRPGGGFMNGYQGNMTEHWRKTLFQENSNFGSALSNHIPSYAHHMKKSSYPSNQSSPTPYKPSTVSNYGVYTQSTSQKQPSHATPQGANTPSSNSWERKENPPLHPAIRQEYSSMMRSQSHAPTQHANSQQSKGPIMQPPAMYDRQAIQNPGTYQNPSQIQNSSLHQSSEQPQNGQPHTGSPALQHQQSARNGPQLHIFQPQPQTRQERKQPQTQQGAQQSVSPVNVTPLCSVASEARPLSQVLPQPQVQESKAIYPHQESYKKPQPQTKPHVSLSPQPNLEFPDVPVDSTSLVEKMMAALRQAN